MAHPTAELIAALDETIERLEQTGSYQWGHMGLCNCGFLAQTITGLRSAEIHESAMEREGDWSAQAREYCPTSGLLIDTILATLFEIGMTPEDVRDLERLSNRAVLRRLGGRALRQNVREDVLLYMRTWRAMLWSAVQSEGKHRSISPFGVRYAAKRSTALSPHEAKNLTSELKR